jgi:hypothetical protein
LKIFTYLKEEIIGRKKRNSHKMNCVTKTKSKLNRCAAKGKWDFLEDDK